MNQEPEDSFNENKLVNRDLLILLNERYRNLDISIEKMLSLQSVFQEKFTDLKIDVERLKTTGKIYTAIIAFIAGIAASIVTALIMR
jgi:hypothetical protein